jgi:hypothetical protein
MESSQNKNALNNLSKSEMEKIENTTLIYQIFGGLLDRYLAIKKFIFDTF